MSEQHKHAMRRIWGRVVEEWEEMDQLGMMRQLGV